MSTFCRACRTVIHLFVLLQGPPGPPGPGNFLPDDGELVWSEYRRLLQVLLLWVFKHAYVYTITSN